MKLAVVFFASVLFPAFAYGQSALKECFAQHNQCVEDCFSLDSEGSQASCITKCAGVEATCAGEVGLESTKPFIREKTEQLEQLLDDFFGDILPKENEPEPPIQSET
jgi:hypothetical protein